MVTGLIAAVVVGLVGLAVYLWVRKPTQVTRKRLYVKTIKRERGKERGETKTKRQPEQQNVFIAPHNLVVEINRSDSTPHHDWKDLLDMLRDLVEPTNLHWLIVLNAQHVDNSYIGSGEVNSGNPGPSTETLVKLTFSDDHISESLLTGVEDTIVDFLGGTITFIRIIQTDVYGPIESPTQL